MKSTTSKTAMPTVASRKGLTTSTTSSTPPTTTCNSLPTLSVGFPNSWGPAQPGNRSTWEANLIRPFCSVSLVSQLKQFGQWPINSLGQSSTVSTAQLVCSLHLSRADLHLGAFRPELNGPFRFLCDEFQPHFVLC